MTCGQPKARKRTARIAPGRRARIDLHVELHPGALRPAAGRTAKDTGSLQHPCAGGTVEIAAGQFVVFHAPPILRSRFTACETT